MGEGSLSGDLRVRETANCALISVGCLFLLVKFGSTKYEFQEE